MTSRQVIENWLHLGEERKATHVLIVCDDFSYEDYPVYVRASEDVHKVVAKYNGVNMQRLMEVYNLSKPLGPQLEKRFNIEY